MIPAAAIEQLDGLQEGIGKGLRYAGVSPSCKSAEEREGCLKTGKGDFPAVDAVFSGFLLEIDLDEKILESAGDMVRMNLIWTEVEARWRSRCACRFLHFVGRFQ